MSCVIFMVISKAIGIKCYHPSHSLQEALIDPTLTMGYELKECTTCSPNACDSCITANTSSGFTYECASLVDYNALGLGLSEDSCSDASYQFYQKKTSDIVKQLEGMKLFQPDLAQQIDGYIDQVKEGMITRVCSCSLDACNDLANNGYQEKTAEMTKSTMKSAPTLPHQATNTTSTTISENKTMKLSTSISAKSTTTIWTTNSTLSHTDGTMNIWTTGTNVTHTHGSNGLARAKENPCLITLVGLIILKIYA